MTSWDSNNNVGKLIFFPKTGTAPPYYLGRGITKIGSAHNADLRIKLETVEPLHGVITITEDCCVMLENKARNNPITLNGLKLRKIEILRDGDSFQVADKTFRFERNPQVKEVANAQSSARLKTANTRRSVTPSFKMKATSKIPVRQGAATDIKKSRMKKSLGWDNAATPSCAAAKPQRSLSTGKVSSIRSITPQFSLRKSLFMKQVARKSSRVSRPSDQAPLTPLDEESTTTASNTPKSAIRTRRSKSLTPSVAGDLISFSSPERGERLSDAKTAVDDLKIDGSNDSFKARTSGVSPTGDELADSSDLSILSLDTPHSVLKNHKPSVLSKSFLFQQTTPASAVKARRARSVSVNFGHLRCRSCTPQPVTSKISVNDNAPKGAHSSGITARRSHVVQSDLEDVFTTPSSGVKGRNSKLITPGVLADAFDSPRSPGEGSESNVTTLDGSVKASDSVVKGRKSKVTTSGGSAVRARRSRSLLGVGNTSRTSIESRHSLNKSRKSKPDASLLGAMFNTPGSLVNVAKKTFGDSVNSVDLENETLSCIAESPPIETTPETVSFVKSQKSTPTNHLNATFNTLGSGNKVRRSKSASAANTLVDSDVSVSSNVDSLVSESPTSPVKTLPIDNSLRDSFTPSGTGPQTRKSRSVTTNLDDSVNSLDCDNESLSSDVAESPVLPMKTRGSKSASRSIASSSSTVKTRQLKSVTPGFEDVTISSTESPVTPGSVRSRTSVTSANDSVTTMGSQSTPSNIFTSSSGAWGKRPSALRRSISATPVVLSDTLATIPGTGFQTRISKSTGAANLDDSSLSGTPEFRNDSLSASIKSIKGTRASVRRSKSASFSVVNRVSDSRSSGGTRKSKSIVYSIINLVDDSVTTPGHLSKSKKSENSTPGLANDLRTSPVLQPATPVVINLLDDTFKTPAPVLRNRRTKSSTLANRSGIVASTPAATIQGNNSSEYSNGSFDTTDKSGASAAGSDLFLAESPIKASVSPVRTRNSSRNFGDSALAVATKRLRSGVQSKSLLVQPTRSSKSAVRAKQSQSLTLGVEMCLENIPIESSHESPDSSGSKINTSLGRRGLKRARESTGSALRINKRLKYKSQDSYNLFLSDSAAVGGLTEDSPDSDDDAEDVVQNTININNITINIHANSPSKTQDSGSKRLRSLKVQREPQNDLTNIKGLKNLFSPKVQRSPENNLIDVPRFKGMFATPKYAKSPRNDLTNISGIKKLLKTPKPQKSPLNDLTKVYGVKKILKTPRAPKLPVNDLTKIVGVKKLMATPKPRKSPLNDLTEVKGVKKLMATPKQQKPPRNDLTNVKGVKKLMATPKVQKSPLNDLTNVSGVKQLLKTPRQRKSPKNELDDLEGVQELFVSPVVASVTVRQKRSSATPVIEEIPTKRAKKQVQFKIPTPDVKPTRRGRRKGKENDELSETEATSCEVGGEDGKSLDETKEMGVRGRGKQVVAEVEENLVAEAPRGRGRRNAKRMVENEVEDKEVSRGRPRRMAKKVKKDKEDTENDVAKEDDVEEKKVSQGRRRRAPKKVNEDNEDTEANVAKKDEAIKEDKVEKVEVSHGRKRRAPKKTSEDKEDTEADEAIKEDAMEKEVSHGRKRRAPKKVIEDKEDTEADVAKEEAPRGRTRRAANKTIEIEDVMEENNDDVERGKRRAAKTKVSESEVTKVEVTKSESSRGRPRRAATKAAKVQELVEMDDNEGKETPTRGNGRGKSKEQMEVAETDDNKTVKKSARGRAKKDVEEPVPVASGRVLRSRRQ